MGGLIGFASGYQMSKFTIFKATENDIPALINLARSVEHLFGPMVGHGFERVLEVNVQWDALL